MNREKLLWLVLAGVALWLLYSRKAIAGAGGEGGAGGAAGGAAGAGGAGGEGAGGEGGAGGAGGSGGSGGSGGAVIGLGDVAEAIRILAAGVIVPDLKSVTQVVAAGRTTLASAETGKALKVRAYCITTEDVTGGDMQFWSANSAIIWRMNLIPAADTTTGANLVETWPGYIFKTNTNEGIHIVTAGAATVSVSYWSE